MTISTRDQRELSFSSWSDVITEVRALHTSGYQSRGNWNLAQTCTHLADWIRFPMDGFPKPPLPIRAMFWVMKVTVAKKMKQKILTEGFKPGTPTAPETVIAPDAATDEAGVDLLLSTIERARNFNGELIPSPLFGPMDHDTWLRVNLLHAEHHLGLLEPK